MTSNVLEHFPDKGIAPSSKVTGIQILVDINVNENSPFTECKMLENGWKKGIDTVLSTKKEHDFNKYTGERDDISSIVKGTDGNLYRFEKTVIHEWDHTTYYDIMEIDPETYLDKF